MSLDHINATQYGVARPQQKGGQPILVDKASDLFTARADQKYWTEKEGEQAYVVVARWEKLSD